MSTNKILSEIKSKKILYISLGYILLLGLSLFLTGYFWQEKATRLQTLYYLLVVTPVLLTIITQIKRYDFNLLFILAFSLIVYYAASVLWSDMLSSDTVFRQVKKVILLLSLFFSVSYVGKQFSDYDNKILHVILFFATSLALYNIYDLITTVGISSRIGGWGVLDNANTAAEVFGVLFLFAFMQFLKSDQKPKILIYLLISTIIFIEMILNKSRGQQLALFVGILLVIYFSPRQNLKRLIPILLLGVVSLGFILYSTDIIETIFNRNLRFDCRTAIWQELMTTAMQSPIFGRGAGASPGYEVYCSNQTSLYYHAHSVYMNTFLHTGLVGVVLGLSLTGYAVIKAFNSTNKNDVFWGIVIIYGFIALLPNGDSLVPRPNEVWMLFWIPVAFIASRASINQQKELSPS